MIGMLKRHEVQVLRRAGHTLMEVAALSGVSVGTVRRIEAEAAVETVDNGAERAKRQIGRPSKAEAFREVLRETLRDEPTLRSVELLHLAGLVAISGVLAVALFRALGPCVRVGRPSRGRCAAKSPPHAATRCAGRRGRDPASRIQRSRR